MMSEESNRGPANTDDYVVLSSIAGPLIIPRKLPDFSGLHKVKQLIQERASDSCSFVMEVDGSPFINLTDLSMHKCQRLIQAFGTSIRKCATLAEAEQKVASTTINLGGNYRDLLHLLSTETRAALLAVERRHFESSFTTC